MDFLWTEECSDAMERLKEVLTNALALSTIDYSEETGEIILAVDATGEGWGAILHQTKEGKRHT